METRPPTQSFRHAYNRCYWRHCRAYLSFFFNAAKYEPWNYIVVLCGIALVIATPITIFRIFIRPIREEEAEIAHLNRVYEEQRFINRE